MQSTIRLADFRTLVVEPKTEARSIVIMLHGYAMRPEDLSPFAASMQTSSVFYFPQGPENAVPQGFAWWTIDHTHRREQLLKGPRDLMDEYPMGRPEIRKRLLQLIHSVLSRHAPLPLILAGFSQGGMLACDIALQETAGLAGLALLSTSRIATEEWTPQVFRLRRLPVFAAHGRNDPDLAFSAGNALQSSLSAAGASVTWVPFDGRHEIPLVVWRQLKRFLRTISDP